MSRTSKRRREKERMRADGASHIANPGLPTVLARAPTIGWEGIGMSREEACRAVGLDPDGPDEQFVVLEL
jgi:hypothetical protein